MARNPLQIGDDTNPLAGAPFAVGDPTDPAVVAGARNTVNAVDKLGQWLADRHAEGVKAGNWVGGYPWRGGHPTWQAAKGAVDEYAQGMLLGTTSSGGGLRAYHGSPAKFAPVEGKPLGAFDDRFINTGEGAQAYGYGHYVAENEGVARGYRDALAPGSQLAIDGTPVSGMPDSVRSIAQWMERTGKSPEELIPITQQRIVKAREDAKSLGLDPGALVGEHQATLDAIDRLKGAQVGRIPSGHMYEVNVAADPEKFLHWDKPLSEQHPDVKDAAHAALLKSGIDRTMANYIVNNKTGRDLHSTLARGEYRPDLMAPEAGAPGAALALKEAGIPGIRYLDAGSRGPMVQDLSAMTWAPPGSGPWGVKGVMDPKTPTGWREFPTQEEAAAHSETLRSHNAVVFDPATMEIIRRYGLAGLMGGGAAAASQQQPNALVAP